MKIVTLSDAVAGYMRHLEDRDCSSTHVRTVIYRLRRFTRGREDVPIRLAAADLDVHFQALRESGLSSGTLAGHKSTHQAFWRWCADRRLCSKSAAAPLKARPNRYSFRPVHSRAATAADFAAVIAALPVFAAHRDWRPRDVRDAALVSLAADSARRRGELWNLRRVDVARALERPETLPGGRLVYHAESEGKTGPATVRFYDESAMLLRRWLELLPAGATFVFVNLRTGERLRPDAMHLGLLRICEFAGVPPFRFHAIRKRVVTDIIAATGDAKIGQLMAGHTSERTTQMYYNDVAQMTVDAAGGALADRLRSNNLVEAFFRRGT